MKKSYINDYGVVITAMCVDNLGQLTYKFEFNGNTTWNCVSESSFYKMLEYNGYKEMK